jgi:P63C domain
MTKILKATHGSEKTPLKIGDLEIDCYVLEDGTRVLSQRGVNKALSVSEGGGQDRALKMPRFLAQSPLKAFISAELSARVSEPIRYLPPHGGNPANGIPATVLPQICRVWVQARDAGALKTSRQHETANKAEIIENALKHVGIIALVDEVTGYQKSRSADDLQRILEAYVSKEYLPYTSRFPSPFYEQLFRLNGWQYNPLSVKRPQVVGKMTDNIVYSRLPEGVLEELRNKNPKDDKGRRKRKHYNFLTEDIGNPHLEKHLAAVIALMRIAPNWRKFKSFLNRAFPQQNHQFELLEEDDEE